MSEKFFPFSMFVRQNKFVLPQKVRSQLPSFFLNKCGSSEFKSLIKHSSLVSASLNILLAMDFGGGLMKSRRS